MSGSEVAGDTRGREKRRQEPISDLQAWLLILIGMGRPKRAAEGGCVYHVLNRAKARMTIFERDADYAAP